MTRSTPTGSGSPRWQPLAVVGGVLVVVLVVAGLVSLPEQPPSTSTTMALPAPTTTTTRGAPLPPPETVSRGSILGAGWELLDPGPIHDRNEASAVWTGAGLFVWGGFEVSPYDVVGGSLIVRYPNDGFLWDPVTETWSGPIRPPDEVCSLQRTRLMWLDLEVETSHPAGPILGHDGYVLLYGEGTGGSPCLNSVLYRPSDGTWHDFGVIGGIFPYTSVVWLPESPEGPLVVTPDRGVGHAVPDPRRQVDLPRLVQPFDHRARSTATRGFWTGDALVSWGLGSVQGWAFGDDDWHPIADPPIPDGGRDAVWTGRGLLLTNHQMAAAILDGDVWERLPDLPLRLYECLPEAVAVAGTPVVRMCSGMAIWDQARGAWIPAPLADLTADPEDTLVGGDDAVYSIGLGFRRFAIDHDEFGRIVPPTSVPVGVVQLDVPAGWDLTGSFAPTVDVTGAIPGDETIGVVFERDEVTCRVGSTYAEFGLAPPAGTRVGGIALGPTGSLEATAYDIAGDEDDEWGILYVAEVGTGTDWVTVRCSGRDRGVLSDAAASFGGLWSPWDPQPRVATPYEVGPGWSVLDEDPGRGEGAAVVWDGSGLFVWGGSDAEARQPATRYDPVSGVWLPTAPLPDDVCSLFRASVSMMGELVLVRGAAKDRIGCSQAAVYDPIADAWTALDSPFFDRIPLGSDVVWTGEWLAAPTVGLAYVAASGETIAIPEVPDSGSRVGSPTLSHWTGDMIVSAGSGDVFTLVPGDASWSRIPGPPVVTDGRDSVWSQGWLYVVTDDNHAARRDLAAGESWETVNLPLGLSECDTDMTLAGDLPVARTCTGMAVWDAVRGVWVPFPSDVIAGGGWWTSVVGSETAVYSLGERLLRYAIERLGDGTIETPGTIPVGTMQLDIPPSWWLLWSVGSLETEWPDGSTGDGLAFALSGPSGVCTISTRRDGPLPIEVGGDPSGQYLVMVEFEEDVVVIANGGEESAWVSCDTDSDEALLADGFWLPATEGS